MIARLVSNGSSGGTFLTVEGKTVQGLTDVRFHQPVDDLGKLTIEMILATVDVEGPLRLSVIHPIEGDLREVASIVFADGTRLDVE